MGTAGAARRRILLALGLCSAALWRVPAVGQLNVLTYHYDNARSGVNASERQLNPDTVAGAAFGLLFSDAVDGNVYGQPLYVAGLALPDAGTHNVVYVATEHDSVYAFDADQAGPPLWQASFIDPASGITTVPSHDSGSTDITPEVGITGTPVIDPRSRTVYVVAKTKENGDWVQRLHALDLATGAEKLGGPVTIDAAVAGTGAGSVNGVVAFNALTENQRAGLLLANGVVYIAWASHGDTPPYHGWLIGYDAATLEQVAVFNDTPNGGFGGIWQSGCAPAADAGGNIYVASGNGTFDADHGGIDFGSSFLKLSKAGGLTLVDSFTPFNQLALSRADKDFGSGGVLLVEDPHGPVPHLALTAGKDGGIYVVNRDAMGGYHATDNSQAVQTLPEAIGPAFDAPAFWNSTLYFAGAGDSLKAFHLQAGQFAAQPVSQTSQTFGFPGATPVVSANGSHDGIVWIVQTDNYGRGPATLHAYDATDLSRELYAGTADKAVKFAVPTVANGKVYVPTAVSLSVFGLPDPPPASSTNSGSGGGCSIRPMTPPSAWADTAYAILLGCAIRRARRRGKPAPCLRRCT